MADDMLGNTLRDTIAGAKERFVTVDASRIRDLVAAQSGITNVTVTVSEDAVAAGASNGIAFFTASFTTAGRQEQRDFVLRYDPGQRLFQQNRLRDEFFTLKALAGRGLPVPAPYWLDETGSILGREGYVLERVHGDAPSASIYSSGPLAGVDSGVRHEMMLQAADFIADLSTVGLTANEVPHLLHRGGSTDPVDGNLQWWLEELNRSSARADPAVAILQHTASKLSHAKPQASYVLVHGDTNFGNMMYRDNTLVAVLDWELAYLGFSESDLAFTAYISEIFKAMDRDVDGVPTEHDYVTRFESQAGRTVTHWEYHRAYARFMSACVALLVSPLLSADVAAATVAFQLEHLDEALREL